MQLRDLEAVEVAQDATDRLGVAAGRLQVRQPGVVVVSDHQGEVVAEVDSGLRRLRLDGRARRLALALQDELPLGPLALPIDGDNNNYLLACPPDPLGIGNAQPNSDVLTTRRTTVAVSAPDAGRIQIQSTRIQGQLFADGNVPPAFDPLESETHNLLINSYYVADSSSLIPGVPTLRRKSLVVNGGAPDVDDQEVAPGVENIQLQFGLDVNQDNTVDRYVNPGDPVLDPLAAGFIPGAAVMTVRVWMVVRSISPENGIVDTRDYEPGDVDLGVYNDEFRRMEVSKTILLRNART